MKIDDEIRDEKLQYEINKEGAKTSAVASGIIDMNILQVKIYCL